MNGLFKDRASDMIDYLTRKGYKVLKPCRNTQCDNPRRDASGHLELGQFYVDNSKDDGLQSWCKHCQNQGFLLGRKAQAFFENLPRSEQIRLMRDYLESDQNGGNPDDTDSPDD